MRARLATTLIVVCSSTLSAQSARDRTWSDFDRYVETAVRDWEVPGLAVAVVEGDRIAFAKGYGVRALGGSDPVDTLTLFANASTTKAFVAMAVGTLVDDGRLKWDDPLAAYLNDFRLADPHTTQQLTIRHALSHRTGFGDPSYLWYGMPWDFDSILDRLRYLEPASGWSARYAYNNVTYAAAGVIAGQLVDMTWEDLVRTNLLEPLGMTATVTNTAAANAGANVAKPHDRIDDKIQPIERYDLDNIGAAGAMYSNVADMSRWIRMLLDSGRVDGRRLVKHETFVELFTPQTLIAPTQFYPTAQLTHPNFTAYGLGWFLQDYRGEKIAFHTGSIDGMVAIVGLLPRHRIGIVVFANRDHAELRHALMFRVFDRYLDGGRQDWSADLLALYDSLANESEASRQEFEGARRHGTAPTLTLAAYEGEYADSLYGRVTITNDGNSLVLHRSPFLTADLEHWHFDTFRSAWRNRWVGRGTVTFRLGAHGRVTELDLGNGFVLHRAPGDRGRR